jgi:hypothetical protein
MDLRKYERETKNTFSTLISELKGKVITNIRAYCNSPFASGLSSGGFG